MRTKVRADLAEHDLSSLRLAVTGAATIPVQLIRDMRDVLGFDTVITGYGLTESTGVVTMCRHDDDPETIATTSGRAIPGVEVKTVVSTAAQVRDLIDRFTRVDGEVGVAREPARAARRRAAAPPVVPHDRGELAPLAHAGAVADEEAGAVARGQPLLVLLQCVHDRLELHAAEHAARERLAA